MTTPIVFRNKTRFSLVFRYKSPNNIAFHKLLDGDGNAKTLEPGGVLMVDAVPGALWQASIPSSDYVYGSQWVQPYKFMSITVPMDVQQGDVFDVSESGFINRDPMPGGMTGSGMDAHPVQAVGPVMRAKGNGGSGLMGKLKAHETAVAFAGTSLVVLLLLAAVWWWYGRFLN